MRFDLESWRKLYVSESPQHRLMSVFSRAFRDFLLRHAEPDGVVIRSSKDPVRDLCKVIGAEKRERKLVEAAVNELRSVGYLRSDPHAVIIDKYAEAQGAKKPGAVRQKRYRDRKNGVTGDDSDMSPGDVTNDVTNDENDEREDEASPSPRDARFRMHPGWLPAEPSRQACLVAMVPEWALATFVGQFVGHFANERAECTDAEWNQRWVKWVTRGWSDPKRRPKRPQPEKPDDTAEGWI